ncbi:cell wall hydrolase [Bacillus sp. CGMCC 1.16607]|uniref:cell wall hydrolase n=1 Tax=Bacillus sp. CGMCC 1.16607 TaxID=3351842 RepID=UPI0036284053
MKKMKKLLIGSALSLSIFGFQLHADAAVNHKVKSGETFWKIASKYGVPIHNLMNVNNRTSSQLNVGETLEIPASISQAEKDLLARLVSAEAKGESYAGKVAVATVVLNRVDHPKFPNTIKGVIYQISGGHYAFSPVQNGAINRPADSASKKAVNEALAFRGGGKGSIYFYNPKTAKSSWIKSRPVTTKIGNHVFAL